MLLMIETIQKLFGCKMISIIHDLIFKQDKQYNSKLYNSSRKSLLKKSNVVISPSKYITQQYNHIKNIITIHHPDIRIVKPHITINKITNKIRILIFGHNKGNNQIKEFIDTMDDNNSPCVYCFGCIFSSYGLCCVEDAQP